MTRGNAREIAREKNTKKNDKSKGQRKDEAKDLTPQQRREYDALQLKAKKEAKEKKMAELAAQEKK